MLKKCMPNTGAVNLTLTSSPAFYQYDPLENNIQPHSLASHAIGPLRDSIYMGTSVRMFGIISGQTLMRNLLHYWKSANTHRRRINHTDAPNAVTPLTRVPTKLIMRAAATRARFKAQPPAATQTRKA